MKPQVSAISLAVQDVDRAKRFYTGLGWSVQDEYAEWVSYRLGAGSSMLGLRPWRALAQDAGAAPDGSGSRGIALSYVVREEGRVAQILAEAEQARGHDREAG